jgi:hypothetical protein
LFEQYKRYDVAIGQEVTEMRPTGAIAVYTSGAVDADTDIVLSTAHLADCQAVTIALGGERLTLEFYDVANLQRLSDVAAQGAELLRAAIQAA